MTDRVSRRAFLSSAALAGIGGLAGCSSLPGAGSSGTLRLLDWDYVYNNDVIAGFEERHGVTVERESAQSSAQSLSRLRAGRSDHDLIALGNYAVTPAMEEGYLQPIDLSQVPAYDNIFPFVKKDYFRQDGELYGVPRSFGQTPLAVNTDMIDADITSLRALFDDRFEGLVGGRDDARLQFLYERAAFGRDPLNPQSVSEDSLRAMKENLTTHVSLSGGLWSSGGSSEQLMKSEQVGVQPVWNYVIVALQNDGLPVERVYPEEGTKAWFLQYTVPTDASNVDLAHTFIQEWHERMGYTSLMKPFSIAIPNGRVFDENGVDRSTYGLDSPDQFIYEDPKPQSLVETYTETWNEAKSEA